MYYKMKKNLSYVIKYLFVLLFVTNATVVPFINKCKMDDPNCILRSAQAVIPTFAAGMTEYGVGILDPAYFKIIDASTNNLKLVLSDVYIRGLKGCIAKKISFQNNDKSSTKLSIKIACSVELDAQYEMKGQLLIPIEGKGKLNSVLSDTLYKVDCALTEKTRQNNKKYWIIKECTHNYDFKANSKIHFDNLFPNNKVLAQATQEVIESNADVVTSEVGPAIVKCVIDMIVKNIGKFSENVPIEDLVL